MKLLGKGAQYRVFDLGNGRVLKVPHSICYQCALGLYLWLQGKTSFVQSCSAMKRAIRMRRDSVASIKYAGSFVDQRLLANPVFLVGTTYIQDKVVILDEVLNCLPLHGSKEIVDQYIGLILTTWKHGFSDTVFAFAVNNGLNAQGEVVQIDFGAIVFAPDLVETHIINKRWLKTDSYRQLKNEELKKYFRLRMDSEINLPNLHKLWGTKLNMTRIPEVVMTRMAK